jgi:small subunit ribosomal protein S21
MKILVRDNNIEQALRTLKRKVQREGILRDFKATTAYEKPSEKRRRTKEEAVRRWRKAQRKRLEKLGY